MSLFRFPMLSLAAFLLALSAGGTGAAAQPKGIGNAGDLIAYFKAISGRNTVSGQFIERGPLDPIARIHRSTGYWLGMIGGDYYSYDSRGPADTRFNAYAVPYWRAGGLITLSLSMPNPTTGGPLHDTSRLDSDGLLVKGTRTNRAFLATLDQVAAGLQQLQASGVVVVLRPFHEMNGDFFWWGTSRLSDARFIALWRFVHAYFETDKQLHNLVWLYATAGIGSLLDRYPGDDTVDMVGQDLYSDHPARDGVGYYETLLRTGKPVAMSEFGPGHPWGGNPRFSEPDLIAAIKRTMPKTVYFLHWWDENAGRAGWGMAEARNVRAALADPWVINRDRVGQEGGAVDGFGGEGRRDR